MHSWDADPGAPALGTRLCAVEDIPDGGAREVCFAAEGEPFRVLLLRRNAVVRAYRNRCPHFSIPLNCEEALFHVFDGEILMCAHHTAMFRVEDGYCYDGPCAGAFLDAIPVRCVDGVVTIG